MQHANSTARLPAEAAMVELSRASAIFRVCSTCSYPNLAGDLVLAPNFVNPKPCEK